MPFFPSRRHAFKIIYVPLTFVVILSLIAGCSGSGTIAHNDTPAASLPNKVPPAPHQIYIKEGQHENFSYWGHTITVNYTSAYPTQIIKVTIDGSETVLQKEVTDSPQGIDWRGSNLSFTLKPVVWEIRDGQNVPIYESTWNTREVYFEVEVLMPLSEVTGGPHR
jgi:hypothetical protein